MKIYNVSNPEKLFAAFDACTSDVQIELSDGSSYAWNDHRDLLVALMQHLTKGQLSDIRIRLTQSEDMDCLMHYLMECRRTSFRKAA